MNTRELLTLLRSLTHQVAVTRPVSNPSQAGIISSTWKSPTAMSIVGKGCVQPRLFDELSHFALTE
jgi:hypothetical protein